MQQVQSNIDIYSESFWPDECKSNIPNECVYNIPFGLHQLYRGICVSIAAKCSTTFTSKMSSIMALRG